jgi:hypothetical protein
MALPPLQGLGVRGSSSGSGLPRAFCCGLGLLWRLRLGGSGTLYVSGDEETAAVAGQAGAYAWAVLVYGAAAIERTRGASRERTGGNSPPPLALLSDEKIYVNTTAVLTPLTSQRL